MELNLRHLRRCCLLGIGVSELRGVPCGPGSQIPEGRVPAGWCWCLGWEVNKTVSANIFKTEN